MSLFPFSLIIRLYLNFTSPSLGCEDVKTETMSSVNAVYRTQDLPYWSHLLSLLLHPSVVSCICIFGLFAQLLPSTKKFLTFQVFFALLSCQAQALLLKMKTRPLRSNFYHLKRSILNSKRPFTNSFYSITLTVMVKWSISWDIREKHCWKKVMGSNPGAGNEFFSQNLQSIALAQSSRCGTVTLYRCKSHVYS